MATFLDAHQTFAVWGAGRSGIAAANLLAAAGKQVILSDSREDLGALDNLDERVEVIGGGNTFEGCEVIVTSPGLKPSLPIFQKAADASIPVISEIELAIEVSRAPFVAITGTDGKTTTTSLIGAVYKHHGTTTEVAGNIGTPLCEVIEQVPEDAVVVAEVSAFQLWTTHNFKPRDACLTNLADDHLDYFEGDFDDYCEAKRAMILNMDEQGWLWLNGHDERARTWANGFPGKVGFFALEQASTDGGDAAMWFEDGKFYFSTVEQPEPTCWCEDTSTLGLSGPHNMLNMLCAAGITHMRGVPFETIVEAFTTFVGLPHRFESLGVAAGVHFIDDSKATNAHAAMAGLKGLEDPFVAIVGGVDKGLDLGAFCQHLAGHASAVISIGELRGRLATELADAGFDSAKLHEAESMEEAVEKAHRVAGHGGTVVLSPACSSFDMFRSYAHRGEVFQQAVARLRATEVGE